MREIIIILLSVITISGCAGAGKLAQPGQFSEGKHLLNVTRLTFEGDNGEAYFSPDGSQLIFQSNRGGYDCDKIWIMNIDGSNKHMVSPDHGAHTCSFFFPDGKKIIFASTSHLSGACPPRPETPKGAYYAWPLYPYNIFTANPDGSGMKKSQTMKSTTQSQSCLQTERKSSLGLSGTAISMCT